MGNLVAFPIRKARRKSRPVPASGAEIIILPVVRYEYAEAPPARPIARPSEGRGKRGLRRSG
ncbi:hypothetical protein J5J86_04120 [Aquabacter sp. L1I39]|uniref:hypothetical protein n=1 Tax=Aquabacter sp. L1I39 TaxID=2820278 RepID=UPI001ADB1156|nr:hypothetical protein [Aquabacter sp. L1I39]QTL04534.1 hypothetical protein J5J86_04120 [Aquabacter sp. L1I39]